MTTGLPLSAATWTLAPSCAVAVKSGAGFPTRGSACASVAPAGAVEAAGPGADAAVAVPFVASGAGALAPGAAGAGVAGAGVAGAGVAGAGAAVEEPPQPSAKTARSNGVGFMGR